MNLFIILSLVVILVIIINKPLLCNDTYRDTFKDVSKDFNKDNYKDLNKDFNKDFNKETLVSCNNNQIEIDGKCYNCPDYSIYDPNLKQCFRCKPGYYAQNNTCVQCTAGTVSGEVTNHCVECVSGSYTQDNVNCNVCSLGSSASQYGSTMCITCPNGTIQNADKTQCKRCADGWIANNDKTECLQCPANTYVSEDLSKCTACPDNKSSKPGSTSVIDCVSTTCPSGQILVDGTCNKCPQNYVPNSSKTECVCPSGLYPNYNKTYCKTPCPTGYYRQTSVNGNFFSEYCVPCPGRTTTIAPNATSSNDCVLI